MLRKRLLSLALSISLALPLLLALPLCVSAGTASKTTVSAVVKTDEILYTGSASDAFRVAVNLSTGKNEPGLASYVVTVRWDPNALELVTSPSSYEGTGCYFTDAFSDGWKMIPNGSFTLVNTEEVSKGKITITSGSANNRSGSDGTLFVLCFRPKKGGVTTEITVTPGSSNVAPGAAFSSASGKFTSVETEGSKRSLRLLSATAKRGDVDANGKINALDYLMVKRHVLGTFTMNAAQQLLADINRDGKINALDYAFIKRHVMGTYQIP